MGTRALLIFNEVDKHRVVIYKHWDGFPENVMNDMARSFAMVKPGSLDIGDIAAAYVATVKKGPGDVYIYGSALDDVGQDYTFVFEASSDALRLDILSDYQARQSFYFDRNQMKWIPR